jgi:hypothetical protein
MIVFGALLLIGICGMLWGWSSRETSEGQSTTATRKPFSFWPSAVTVTAGSICLLAAPSVAIWSDVPANQFGITIKSHDAVVENLNTLSDIVRLVMSKKA